MKVKISGTGSIDTMLERLRTEPANSIKSAAEIVKDAAKELCPVDTGALRDSITVQSTPRGAQITAPKDYAVYVEFGTQKSAAKPFLVPALLNNREKVLEAIKNDILG